MSGTDLERALLGAIGALTVITRGRVYFKTRNGIPMGMSKHQERIVKHALKMAEQVQALRDDVRGRTP